MGTKITEKQVFNVSYRCKGKGCKYSATICIFPNSLSELELISNSIVDSPIPDNNDLDTKS